MNIRPLQDVLLPRGLQAASFSVEKETNAK